ncbi:MAG: hypothetical protein AB1918_07780 [Pseudomonadota bacterium]
MLPFLTVPAVAPACYKPAEPIPSALAFRAAASAHLTRAAVGGNRQTWTLAGILMLAGTGDKVVFGAGTSWSGNRFVFSHGADGRFFANSQRGGAYEWDFSTTEYFRDYGAPLPFVLSCDTTLGANGMTLEIDGRAVGLSWSIGMAQNHLSWVNEITVPHRWGRHSDGAMYLDGIGSHFLQVDGAKLPFSAIFEPNIHGVWVLRQRADIYASIAAAGGWGANGSHLDFSDPLSPGLDVSGQGNHWTASGFDAAGADTVDSTPTLVYPAFQPLAPHGPALTLSHANLRATTGGSGGPPYNYTIPTSMPIRAGKRAWKTKLVSRSANLAGVGLMPANTPLDGSSKAGVAGTVLYYDDGKLYVGTTSTVGWGAALAVGDAWVTALNADTGEVWFGKITADTGPVAWQGGGDPVAGTNPAATLAASPGGYLPFIEAGQATTLATFEVDFGQRGFVPPSGFELHCTDTLPEPVVKDPAEAVVGGVATGANLPSVMDAATAHWEGDDYLEWAFNRAGGGVVRSTVRGLGYSTALHSTAAEGAFAGFSGAANYVAHRWRLGARYGCLDVIVNKAVAGAETFAHGMGKAIGMMVARDLNGGDTYMFHKVLGGGRWIKMNTDGVAVTDATAWADTAPTLQDFTLGTAFPIGARVAVSLFADIPGLSDFTEYTGTNSGTTDGAFAPMSILPQLVIGKHHDSVSNGSWWLADTARCPTNPVNKVVWLSAAASAEGTYDFDFDVGALKLRNTAFDISGKWLVAAWGRPIGGVCVAPANAR